MKWVLIFIGIAGNDIIVSDVATFERMDLCFEERDHIIETLGRPIVNYQAVCVAKIKPVIEEE